MSIVQRLVDRTPLAGGWADALLDQRPRFHVALRTTTRLDRWLRVFVGPQPRTNLDRLTWATAASVAVDLAGGAWLRTTDRFGFGWRLAADTADTAAWAAVEGSTYDRAVLAGVPLAVEAGARLDAGGLVVPAAGVAAAVPVRRLRGWPARPQTFLWQVAGVGLGAALARYEEDHRAVVLVAAEERRAARRTQANLDGHASVAMTADSVVDLLANTGWRLAAGSDGADADAARWLRGWKAQLAERTRASEHASYLSTALARWEQSHNRHPDLAADVELAYQESTPPVVLTARQVAELHASLDALALRGSIAVELVPGRREPLPGRALRVAVGDAVVAVPADVDVHVEAFDPTPVVGALAATWYASTAARNLGAVPLPAVAPGVLGSLASVVLLERRRRVAGRDLPLALGVHAAIGIVHAALATATMRQRLRGDGMQPHPWAPALGALSITSALAWRELGPRGRAAVAGAAAAIIGAGLVADRQEVRWSQLPLAVAGPAAAWWAARGLADRLGDETDEVAADLGGIEQREVEEAFADGRSAIIEVASAARFEIWQRLEAHEHELPDELAAVIRADLQVADDLLASL